MSATPVPHRDKHTGQAVAAPHGTVMGPAVEHVDAAQGAVEVAGLFRRASLHGTPGHQAPGSGQPGMRPMP
ncbi:hypothetical protein [Sinomonas soli]